MYQPKTGARCSCKRGFERDNCASCEGTGQVIDFAAIRARTIKPIITEDISDQCVRDGFSPRDQSDVDFHVSHCSACTIRAGAIDLETNDNPAGNPDGI
jgi:hypothetical protein